MSCSSKCSSNIVFFEIWDFQQHEVKKGKNIQVKVSESFQINIQVDQTYFIRGNKDKQ